MPSSITGANHDVKRRRRHHRSRNNTPSRRSRRSPQHPRLREHSSHDLENCFGPCQERGLHLDPDVRIGAAVSSSGNRFSALERVESTSHSPSSTPTPLDSNFSERLPTVETPSVHTVPNDVSLNLDALPATPPLAPRVRLPGLCSSEPDPIDLEHKSPTFLREFTIPSPLLYHKKSREGFFDLDDIRNPSEEKASLSIRQDSPDVNSDYDSRNLARPYKRVFLDQDPIQSSNDIISGVFNDHKLLPTHDFVFYQNTRTYLNSSSEGGQSSAVTVLRNPQPEPPIATSRNTMRKRKAHGCPKEREPSTPETSPSSARNASRPEKGIIVPSQAQSSYHKDKTHISAGLATPPDYDTSPTAPAEITSKKQDGNSENRTGKTRTSRPIPSSSSEGKQASSLSITRKDSDPPSKAQWAHDHGYRKEQTKGRAKNSSSAVNKPRGNTTDTPPRPTYAAVAAAAAAPSQPAAAVLPNSSVPTTDDRDVDIRDPDLVHIRACPTSSCHALLVSPPQPLDEHAVLGGRFADDLGFEVGHGEGCQFGRGEGTDVRRSVEVFIEEVVGEDEEEEGGWVRLGMGGGRWRV